MLFYFKYYIASGFKSFEITNLFYLIKGTENGPTPQVKSTI